jgi:hypothetical protein
MAQDPLLTQLAERCRIFSAGTGISLNKMARLIGTEPANFSAFVNGRIGLSSKSTIKLLQLLSLTKREVETKLGVTNVQIAHYQQNGVQMRLDSGGSWVPGLSGQDPNGSDDVTGVKTDRDLDNSDDYQARITAFLKDQQSIYRQAIAHIDNYLANVQRGKVNRDGVTSGPRSVNTNDKSSHPGSRGDLLSAAKLKEQLEFVRKERKKTEEQLELQAELKKERRLYWDARVKTLRKQDGQ